MASAAAAAGAQPSLRPIVAKLASPSFGSSSSSSRVAPRSSCKCRATTKNDAASAVVASGCDLYELLGVEGDASHVEIKKAYRWLQKRCHPDVAGDAAGHDMAVLLNDAYAILSNPASRSSYDKVRAEWTQFHGFTGEPLYSQWLGPASEERAVFVDEARCVGCLKCALIASNTFAIEGRFGRARAVGQWGDSEHAIQDAMKSCPVDCISWVNRSRIPALEYVMSKQPRCAVSVGAENNVKERTIDIFQAADKFLRRKTEFESHESSSTMATAGAIRARSGQWWKYFVGRSYIPAENIEATRRGAILHLKDQQQHSSYSYVDSKVRALFEAATRRKLGVPKPRQGPTEEYWKPLERPPTAASAQAAAAAPAAATVGSHQASPAAGTSYKSTIKKTSLLTSEAEMVLASAPWFVSLVGGLGVAFKSSQTQVDSTLQTAAAAATEVDGPLFKLGHVLQLEDIASNQVVQVLSAILAWYLVTTMACTAAREIAILLLENRRGSD